MTEELFESKRCSSEYSFELEEFDEHEIEEIEQFENEKVNDVTILLYTSTILSCIIMYPLLIIYDITRLIN